MPGAFEAREEIGRALGRNRILGDRPVLKIAFQRYGLTVAVVALYASAAVKACICYLLYRSAQNMPDTIPGAAAGIMSTIASPRWWDVVEAFALALFAHGLAARILGATATEDRRQRFIDRLAKAQRIDVAVDSDGDGRT